MSGRFVWIDDHDFDRLESDTDHAYAIVYRDDWEGLPADPVAAFIEATRDRRAFGDAEWQVETIAVGLRALGMPPRD